MDINKLIKWIDDIKYGLDPPGCVTVITSLPNSNQGSCQVGIVQEHRFAFYYWARYFYKTNSLKTVLISVDAHNDVGAPNEVNLCDLDNLDIKNKIELGLFTWLRLRRLNDGHIRPALYLDFFSDVYILLSNQDDSVSFNELYPELHQKDRNNHIHTVKYYQNSDNLLENLPPDCPVFLDIDLDYFSVENHKAGLVLGSEKLRPDKFITSFLSLNGSFLASIFNRITGLTIALEPKYCGGLANSLHVLDILNKEFFDGTLCTNECKWKKVVKPNFLNFRKVPKS